MVSKNDFLVGVLMLIAGILMYEFAPDERFFQEIPMMSRHYIGGILAIAFGAIAFALMKATSKLILVLGVLSIVLGIVFIADAPPMPVTKGALRLTGAQGMHLVGGLEAVVGVAGIVASFRKKSI